MPRPPKKKIKSKPPKENVDLGEGSSKTARLPEGSYDEVQDMGDLMKLRGVAKLGHQSTEKFEKKCSQLVETAMEQIESKLHAHELHLTQLYESVEKINEEIEPTQDEVMLDRIVNKRFDVEINHLSKAITGLTSEQHKNSKEIQRLFSSQETLNLRPEEAAKFSQRMNAECKRNFKIYCENTRFLGDSQRFKEKYKALMKEVL